MKYLVIALLAGCYTGQMRSLPPRKVPGSDVVERKLLKVGQWARYREQDRDVDAGSMELQVVGKATCGMWVRATLYGGGEGRLWMLCVHESGELSAALFNGVGVIDVTRPGEHDADLVGLRTRIVPRVPSGPRRETVQVDAGVFDDAVVETSGSSVLWSHPDVPFAGVVRIVDANGRADTLVAYGDEPPPPRTPRAHLHEFLELGAGFGWLSGVSSPFSSGTTATEVAAGFHAGHGTDLLMAVNGGKTSSIGPSVDTSSATVLITVGGRWRPLELPLYLQLTGGFARLFRYDSIDVNGFGVSAGIGYPLLRAHDWTADVRVSDELSYFGGDVGVRTQLEVGGRFVLSLP